MSEVEKFKTFINPGGFIEQHYKGIQTPDSVIKAITQLVSRTKKPASTSRPILILVDISEVPKIDTSDKMKEARRVIVEAMKTSDYDRIAVYGNVALQVLINTLTLIAGKRQKIRVFPDRVDALKWLRAGKV